MNKKLVSFVLAMVLSAGLGVSSLFAGAYSDQASDFQAGIGGGSTRVNIASYTTTGTGENTFSGGDADVFVGNLLTVFKYYAGTIIGAQGANSTFTLMDSYGARFSVDAKGGGWNVANVSLREVDYARIAGKNDQQVVDWLLELGFSKSSLQVAATDEDGNILGENDEAINVSSTTPNTAIKHQDLATALHAWIDKLKNHMKNGVNYGASISAGTGITGPTLVTSIDGKTMNEYQVNVGSNNAVAAVATYLYDNAGFLTGIARKAFETMSTSSGTAVVQPNVLYTKIEYDKNGVRTDTVYKITGDRMDDLSESGDLESSINAVIKDAPALGKEIGENDNVFILTVTHYSANNSAVSTLNNQTNETTFYANGVESYVMNAQGTVIKAYRYTDNGILQAVFDANGLDSEGNKVGTVTIYDKWGRQLFTATGGLDLFHDQAQIEALKKEYYEGIANNRFNASTMVSTVTKGKTVVVTGGSTSTNDTTATAYTPQAGTGTRITRVCIYADQILDLSKVTGTNGFIDMNLVYDKLNKGDFSIISNKLEGFGYNEKDLKNMLTFANGTSTMLATTDIKMSAWPGGELPTNADTSHVTGKAGTKKGSNIYAPRGVTINGTYFAHGNTVTDDSGVFYSGISYTNTIFIGGAQAYQTKHDVVNSINGDVQTHLVDPVVKGNLWTAEPTEEELQKRAAEKGIDVNDEEAMAALKEEMTNEKLEEKANELGVDINDEAAMEDLKNGFYTKDGKTYAIVDATSINMMDGSGFESVEGETVMVEVDTATKESIISNAASGDRSIMFMGDVDGFGTNANGEQYLVMAMNVKYGGGFVQGEDAIAAAEAEIAEASIEVANNPDAYKADVDRINSMPKGPGKDKAMADFAKEHGVAFWVANNTLSNIDKLGVGGSKLVDNDGQPLEGNARIEEAWRLLYMF